MKHETLADARMALGNLENAAHEYKKAVRQEAESKAAVAMLQDTYDSARSELLYEYGLQGKDGPLGGIAKTSKMYQEACDALVTQASNDGELQELFNALNRAKGEYVQADIALQQAHTDWKRARYAADLIGSMLNALALQ